MKVTVQLLERKAPVAPTDAELLRYYHEGDFESFVLLYNRYSRPLFLYAQSLTQDPDGAEDLIQEAFLRLIRYEPGRLWDNARSFLYAVVRNLARDTGRKSARFRKTWPLLKVRESVDPAPGLQPLAESISRALDQLPEEQRETVVLKIYGGMTLADIATLVAVPIGTVASRYRYAIERLGQLLSDVGGH